MKSFWEIQETINAAKAVMEQATVTVDHGKHSQAGADPYVRSGHRGIGASKWNGNHKKLMKKLGVSDQHSSLIAKHEAAVDSDKAKSSNKSGYAHLTHHDGYTVHSDYNDDGQGGGGVAKYHIHKSK